MDLRLKQIAKNLVNYSLQLKTGQTVILKVKGENQFELGQHVAEYCKLRGINVISEFLTLEEYDKIWKGITQEKLDEIIQREIGWQKKADATCLIRETSKTALNAEETNAFNTYFNEVDRNYRLKKRWVLTSVPNKKDRELYETYLQSCSIDYNKLSLAMNNLFALLVRAKKVRIIAPNTDLEFSIDGMTAVKCIGERNVPDGEIYTAPVKDSVNGYITYNIPSRQNGITHENVYFEFKDGKIINAFSNHTKELNEVLDTDEGARYIGEFSFGVNPLILNPYNNILYDEKISGSIHFTPGNAYERCDNGNRSAIHWDLVQIQRKEYGGGEIWIDDVLIRKDGLFVPENLQALNPENLISVASQKQTPQLNSQSLE